MPTINLALVSEVKGRDPSDVARVAAALQRQASRDFGPIWSVQATVDAFPRLEDVPVGYWPMIVETDINTPGAAGVHEDKNGQPFALITMSDSWSLTASHEMLEMLADPFGRRVIPGKSPKRGQGRVEFLVEVCDPCEAQEFAYTVNDILVSDFYTPHYFDPKVSGGVRYDFTGAIESPRDVLEGGYISWHDPVSNHLWQFLWLRDKEFKDLGKGDFSGHKSIREWVDEQTAHPGIDTGLPEDDPALTDARERGDANQESNVARIATLRDDMKAIMSG